MLPEKDPYLKKTLIVLAIAVVYRLILIGLYPMGPDEASYWTWSCRLDLGYVDHPPLVAYAIRLMTTIFGDTNWASRLLACALAAGSGWFLFQIGKTLFNSRVGFWAATLYTACPMFSMAGGIMLLPESILTFWMTLAILLASRIVVDGNLKRFYVIGIVLGLALLTKYPGLLIVAALGLFAICSPRHRHWFPQKEPYVMAVTGLLFLTPVIIWNIQNDFAGLSFLAGRTHPSEIQTNFGHIHRAWNSFMAQAGYHTPILFLLLWYGMIVLGIRAFKNKDDRSLLLFCFSGPVMIGFLVIAMFRYTLPHWPATGYLAAYVAAPAAFFASNKKEETAGQKKRKVALLTAATALGCFACLLMPALMSYPITTVYYPKVKDFFGMTDEAIEPMAQATGWDGEISDHLIELRDEIREKTGQEPVILTHDHLQASLLAHGLRDVCEVVAIHARGWQFNIWYDDDDVKGKPVIYVSSTMSSHFNGKPQEHWVFEDCTPLPPLPIITHGVTINTVNFWECSGYKGPVEKSDPGKDQVISGQVNPLENSAEKE